MLSGIFFAASMLTACGKEPAGSASSDSGNSKDNKQTESPFTRSTSIREVSENPVFGDYGRLLFPVDEGYSSGKTLESLRLTWYHNMNPDKTVEIANYFYDRAKSGNTVFYNIYSEEEKKEDPSKEDTGLFFFRGKSGAKTACKDLSRAVVWLFDHADALDIDMTGYTLWGGSAGARMADWVGTYGTAEFGEPEEPKPAAVILQYTGLSEITGQEPPTYANVGTRDAIASASLMKRRIQQIQANGTDAEIEIFPGLQHGFGLGEGTSAEGWVDHAVRFWRRVLETQ